ncbi:uncharacterized protein J3D65DRAFT_623379 [Phyllosticta citribraziliensis]|uniref:AAA+ ATPase domain-containing protein n=2 Tax=Phyllosticta TaxID=121621 RepID=A0ABR1LNL1_9PEZI
MADHVVPEVTEIAKNSPTSTGAVTERENKRDNSSKDVNQEFEIAPRIHLPEDCDADLEPDLPADLSDHDHSMLETSPVDTLDAHLAAETASVASTVEPVDESPCNVRYVYHCNDRSGGYFVEKRNDAPLTLEIAQPIRQRPPSVFEIKHFVQVESKGWRQMPVVHGTRRINRVWEAGSQSLSDMKVASIDKVTMVIYSAVLLEAVREVVEYYPSQNFLGDTVTFREPFCALLHHIDELKALKTRLEEDQSLESSNPKNLEKCEHIQVLLDYLDPKIQREILPAQKRLQKAKPTVTYNDLWYLLRPGALSYHIHDNVWIGCVIQRAALVPGTGGQAHDKGHWEIYVWFQDSIWGTGWLATALKKVTVDHFEGEKLVLDLPVFPRDYFDIKDGNKRRSDYQKRGRLIRNILWKDHSYVNYNGKLMLPKVKPEYNGPLIACTTYSQDTDLPDHNWNYDFMEVVQGPEGLDNPKRAASSKIVNPLDLNTKDPDHSPDLLSEEHLFLLCPIMPGFALLTKSWTIINVDWISELGEPDKVPPANIPQEELKFIKALSNRQMKTKVPWSADFIKNKGKGVVVLLHGPPGVGKTYTVETTAMATGRPLISLTMADLKDEEETIEAELTEWFSLANRFKAILLIDEADVFLERRQHKDVDRNAMVSAFLRKMEYFEGLLFLTTTRLGFIDEAFISRVHIMIEIKKLSPERRRVIWKNFLDKLARECQGKIRVAPGATRYILEGAEMCAMDWNGREIRNALQTAIALAEHDAVESEYHKEGDEIIVESEHFQRVMKMSKSFREYLDSIGNDTPEERASRLYGRRDDC